jgi:hypothetical protein
MFIKFNFKIIYNKELKKIKGSIPIIFIISKNIR